MIAAVARILRHKLQQGIRTLAPTTVGFGVLLLLFVGLFSFTRAYMPARVYAATSSTLNFQARLMSSAGSLVPDGSYSIQFKFYDAVSGGVNEWTETQGAVMVRNGYLSVQLGSVTPFGGSIDWSQEKWLTMNVNSDGEMNPRIKLTAVPYSFRSGQADSLTNGSGTLTASDLAQLSPGSLQLLNTAIAAIRINQTGAGGLLQLQGDSGDVFTVAKNGNLTSAGTGVFQGPTLEIGTAAQSGGLMLNDGSSNKGTVQLAALGQNTVYTLPDPGSATAEICLNSGNCGGTGDISQGGNAFGSAVIIGTNDSFALNFETAGTTQLSIDTSGNLNLLNGAFQTGGVTRLTGAGALQNVTGNNSDGVSFDADTITSGLLPVARGGTGVGSFTANGVLYGNNTGSLNVTTAGTGGQILLANSSGVPTFTTLSGDITIDSSGVTTIGADSVSLGADTTGDYVANLGTLTGLSTTGNSGEGSTPTLSVLYGSGANTAVEGDTTLVCAAGAGDLSGGGDTITLGTGGTCSTITISENPAFSVSVTTPLLQNAGLLRIASTTTAGADDIAFETAGTEKLRLLENGSLKFEKGSFDLILDVAAITDSDKTITFPNASGTVCLTSGNCLGGASGGANTALSNLEPTSINQPLIASGNNSLDLGSSGLNWRTGYFGTSVQTPSLTSSGALALSSGGSDNISLDSASGIITIAGNDTTLQRNGSGSFTIDLNDALNTALTLNNSGTGLANLNLQDGGLQTAGTNRLTNGGALENITGLTVISGGANITGNTLVTGTFGTSSTLTVTSGGLIVSAGGADISGGLVLTTGNLNVAAGDIRTNNITRLENDGNLVNIGNLTATGALIIANAGVGNDITLNSADQIIFNAGSTIELQDNTNVTGNVDVSGTIASGTNNAFSVDANGNLKTIFTLLDGSSQTNGTSGPLGASSTSMVLDSAASFDVGNYIRLANTNCGGTGVNICFAKITAKSSNTLTITPALVWADNAAVTEYQVPEIGGTNGSQPLENRYGRGYFIAGVAVGNGTTYYNENSIETSLSTFDLLNTDVTTLNIGGAATTINIGNASGTTTIAGNVSFSGNVSAPATGTSGYLSRSGSILQPSNSGDSFTTSGNISTTGTGTITAAAGLTVQGGGASITGNSTVTGTLGVSSAFTVSAGGASITGGLTLATGALNLSSGGITNAGSIAGATTINASGLATLSGGATVSGAAINLNNNSNFNTNINTGTSTGTITIGGGSAPLVINSTAFNVTSAGALSGITTISASGAITAATSTNTINGLVINSGTLSGVTGITFTSGSLNLASGGITNTGSIAGATTITASGNINTTAGDIQTNTISRLTSTGALQNVTGNNTNGVSFDANTITSGLLPVSRGGTGAGTFTTNGIIYGNNTGALQVTAAGTGGQVLLANTSGVPTFTSLSGDITINSSGVTTIGVNAVALGTDTIGNYLADITIESGGGLEVSGTGSETATASLTIRRDCSNNQIVKWSTSGSGAWNCAADNSGLSDARVKNNVTTVNDNVFDRLKSVRVVEFDFDCTSPAFNNLHCNTDHQAGVIAQELELIFPELVFEDSNGYKNVRYDILGFYNMRALGQLATFISANGDAELNNLQTGGIQRLTNTGQLQNINGLSIISGGASIIGGINNNNGGLTNIGSISGATTINASGRITGMNGLSVTGETINLNVNSDKATNINTGSSTGTVTIGGGSTQLVINSSAFKVSSAGALSGITTINTSGNINTTGVFQANGQSGLSGTCAGNNSYLQNWTITGGIITAGECRTGGLLSDARLKENVVALDDSILTRIKDVNTVNFDFACDSQAFKDINQTCDKERQTGVIAQELAQIFPELVYRNDDGYYRVKYDALNIYTLKATSQIAQKIDDIENGSNSAKTISTNGTVRINENGQLQNINGLSMTAGGGGINNNSGGITEAGSISGVSELLAKRIVLSSQTKEVLVVERDGRNAMTIFQTGALELMLDDERAFAARRASGEDVFSISTSGGLVQVGSAASDASSVLLVLDNIDMEGDPPGIDGAQYYNVRTQRFRCFQNGAWHNCLSAANAEYVIVPQAVSWQQPGGDQEFPGAPRVWIDLSQAQDFRITMQLKTPAALYANCYLQYALTDNGPWRNLAQPGGYMNIDAAGNVKSAWSAISQDAREEVLIRLMCRGGNYDDSNKATATVPEFTNVRVQVR